jgi:NAD(P)-dependent dehydrogenase (short-subunit alcohol dehydrogenase family)
MQFQDKVYVITGTNSGIGKACARQLLDRGANIIGIDIKDGSIQHPGYTHFIADIRNEERVSELFDEIDTRTSRIDGLCNCAGIFANSKPFYELTSGEWDNVIGTNLTGVFLVSKYAARRMIPQRSGKIVNIGCIRAKIYRPNMADYAASKGGIVALTSSMALDLAPYNLRVNCVAPGFTYTGMTARSFDHPEIRKASEDIIPVGRIAEPEDIAKVVLFLLSDLSDYINGETIYTDGGFKISK